MKRKHVAKMVSAVLVTTMLMGLAGCGSSGTKDVTQSGSSSSTGDEGIDPEYKDADMDYEVTRADIKILKQIHSLGDEQYKRLMAYIKALQKLEQMESIVED